MAKHLDSGSDKKEQSLRIKLPPRLYQWKKPERRVFRYERELSKAELLPIAAATILFLAAYLAPIGEVLRIIAMAAAAFVAGFSVIRRGLLCLLGKRLPDEDFLMLPASLLCFLGGRPATGALVVLLLRALEQLQAYVLTRSDRGIDAIRDVLPEKAHLEESFGLVDVLPEEIKEGDICLVLHGEAVPVDAVVLEGAGLADTSFFGREEDPAPVRQGSTLLSGTRNQGEDLRVRALRSFADSALTMQLRSLEATRAGITGLEDKIELLCSLYSPCMLFLAIMTGLISPLLHGGWQAAALRAAALLFLASPSSLVLFVPVVYLGGMTCAAHSGLWIRSKEAMENLAHVRTAVFSKTGTVTEGKYSVTEVFSQRVDEERLLRTAATAEGLSRHPIAAAIREAAAFTEADCPEQPEGREVPGRGVIAFVEGRTITVGNAAMLEERGIWYKIPNREGTAIHVAVDNEYWGYILLSEKLREGAFDSLEELRSNDVRCIAMLTGDVRSSASKLARSLNFDIIKTELTTEGKLSAIQYLQKSLGDRERLLCVGDGFHDAPIFQQADVSMAVNSIADLDAEGAADVLLMDETLSHIPTAIRIARGTELLIWILVALIAAPKLIFGLLTLFGSMPIVLAMLLDAAFEAAAAFLALRGFTVD